MPSEAPISCMAAYTEEAEQGGGLVPLFVGRDDGTVERYDAMQDAELGIPSAAFYAHRRPVTGIIATNAAELHTCSLDGTMKQWALSEVAPEGPTHGAAAAARVRASLTKTTTFPFGVSVMVQENSSRLLLGGDDGSLTLMEGERRSTWRAHDGGAVTAIAVDTEGSNAVLTGGADGVIYVWDMEFGRPVCELRGHSGAIRALSFVPVPPAVPVVRRKRTAEAESPKEVLVPGGGEDGSTATCVLSCSSDGTVKVWLLPDLHEANAEAELLERQQQQQHQQQLQHNGDGEDGAPRRSFGISFQEPTVRVEAVVEPSNEATQNDDGAAAAAAAAADGGSGPELQTTAAGDPETSGSANGNVSVHELDAKEQFLRQQANASAAKSAIKPPERRVVPFQSALGTVELPRAPSSCASPSSSPAAGGGGSDGDGPAGPSLLFIGATQGDVYGIRTRRLVKEVCLHTAHNFQKVQQEVALVNKTLRDGSRVYAKAAAAKIKAEEAVQLGIAAKARRAKMAEAKAARKREAEARRAARRRAAAEAAEDGDEEQVEEEEAESENDAREDEEEEMEDDADDDGTEDPFDLGNGGNGENDAENAEENAGEGETEDNADGGEDTGEGQEHDKQTRKGSTGAVNLKQALKPRRPASWKKLTEEQRTALEAFTAEQEAERDRRVAALRASVAAHIAQVEPLTQTVYQRSRAQFANLPHTISGHIHGGSTVTAMAAASLVAGYADKVFAAQANAVVPVTVAIGLVKL